MAIMLTGILFSVLFTVFYSFRDSARKIQIQSVGMTGHAAIHKLDDNQYDIIKRSSLVENISYYKHYGYIVKGDDIDEELRYEDEKMFEWDCYQIEKGKYPDKDNEILVSEAFVKKYHLKSAIGTKIKLEYEFNYSDETEEFLICGVYSMSEQQRDSVFLSKSKADKFDAQIASITDFGDDLLGTRSAEIFFKNDDNIEENVSQLLEEAQCKKAKYIVNPIYETEDSDNISTFFIVICLALAIVVLGYLIIYNVFYISMRNDTRYYGVLRTLGMSKQEIKKLVYGEIGAISVVAIPLGVVAGYFLTMYAFPQITSTLNLAIEFESVNPLIFVFSVIFSVITVVVSCRKPAKLAVSMPAIQARKYNDNLSNLKRHVGKKENARIIGMARSNLLREKKKTILIIMSVSISFMLVNIVFMIANGMDADKFVKDMISTDFIIRDTSGMDVSNTEAIDISQYQSVFDELNQKDGIEGGGATYMKMTEHTLSSDALINYSMIMNDEVMEEDGFAQEEISAINKIKMGESPVNVDLYGLVPYFTNKLITYEGTIDKDKFASGNYVLVSNVQAGDCDKSCYHAGDKITLQYGDSDSQEYTVMAVVAFASDFNGLGISSAGFQVIIPESQWQAHIKDTGYYMYCYDIQDKYESSWEMYLKNYTDKDGVNLAYKSKETYKDDFYNLMYADILVGGGVSVIIGVIGIINYINVIVTGIYNRKREFAVMQSIGMTKKQIYRLICAEGMGYMGIALALTFSVGSLLGYIVISGLSGTITFIRYNFSITPFIAMLIVCFFAALTVPIITFKHMNSRQNLLERLHIR